jgi:uncharacterized protein involved in exopolysaccharide biosynthesis
MREYDIEWLHYGRLLWARKWPIILGMAGCMLVAGIISFSLKPVYEFDTIVQPGKFFIEDNAGNLQQVVVEDPQQIADKVTLKAFNTLIARDLGIKESELPDFRAEAVKNTLLTRIWLRTPERDLARNILNQLILHLKLDMDQKIDVKIHEIDNFIRQNEIEKALRTKRIDILNRKQKIIDARKATISKEMVSIRARIEELEEEQKKALQKQGRTESEGLGMLLYSNEIQQSLRFLEVMNEKLSLELLQEEDVNSEIESNSAESDKIQSRIADWKQKKALVDHTKVIKEPTASVYPVWPKKKLNIILAAIIGFVAFSLLIILMDYSRQAVQPAQKETKSS